MLEPIFKRGVLSPKYAAKVSARSVADMSTTLSFGRCVDENDATSKQAFVFVVVVVVPFARSFVWKERDREGKKKEEECQKVKRK